MLKRAFDGELGEIQADFIRLGKCLLGATILTLARIADYGVHGPNRTLVTHAAIGGFEPFVSNAAMR